MRTPQLIGMCVAAAMLATLSSCSGPGLPPYKDSKLPVEQRVEDLLRRMTPEGKAAMLSGAGWMETVSNTRLGIPSIKMADGPMGVRSWAGPSVVTNAPGSTLPKITSTSFPVGVGMAATWNPELIEQEGRAIGEETKKLGRDMILAPTVNIARVPLWGRNFEGYGEDPFLSARMGVAFIKGVQAEDVIATVKHFAANNQEYERHRINEKIDERTLHEIYLPAFRAAVQEAGVRSVMSAYNKVNGLWCAENPYLLNEVLRKQWGFKGFVVSDWGGTYSTAETIKAGLNLEMPGGEPMRAWINTPRTKEAGNSCGWLVAEKVLAAVSDGKVSAQEIDERVRGRLRVMFTVGLFDKQPATTGVVDGGEKNNLARVAAAESIVLLKNAGEILPFNLSKVRSIAVIGPSAATARTGGGGSSLVRPLYAITPLDGIREKAGKQVQVTYALGAAMEGESPEKETPQARAALMEEAAAVAAKADAAVVIVGCSSTLESEGFDRKSLDLPLGQDDLVQDVAKSNKNTVVVIQAGSPVAMSKWLNRVPAVIEAWYGGQEGGNGIADVLFGDVNPSGKLPVSFPKDLRDSPAYGHYPGDNLNVEYAEGIYVGYRHFDKRGIEPLFPFGFGLSYTRFEYRDLKITPPKVDSSGKVQVSLQVRNVGRRPGAEVVQLYVRDVESSLDRPVRELKAFRKIFLRPAEAQTITFALDKDAMAFYDPARGGWIAEPGQFEVQAGSSSRDVRLKGSFQLAP